MEVSQVIEETISAMTLQLVIYAVELEGSNYKVYTQNTQYLRKGSRVSIDSKNWKVESFSKDYFLVLSQIGHSDSISTGTYTIANPTFKYGKLKAVNEELGLVTNPMPLIWMLDLSPRTVPQDRTTVIESEGNVRLFFMNSADYGSYTTADHYTNVIKPLNTLVDSFFTQLKKHTRVGQTFITSRTPHAKFTTGGGFSGAEENEVLGRFLSGVEVEIDIPIKVQLTCPVKIIPSVSGFAFSNAFSNAFNVA